MPRKKSKKREPSPTTIERVAESPIAKSRPVRETVVIHTTRERKRNAGVDSKTLANAAAMGGGSVAGGAASVVVAEKAKLDPFWASVVTGGTTLALAQLAKKIPLANKALIGASLGAGGLCGVHLIASHYAKRQQASQPKPHPESSARPSEEKRSADGDNVARTELNDALTKAAETQKQTTLDLITALREEIKADVRAVMAEAQPGKATPPNLIPVSSFRSAGDEDYERNAYGEEDERNAEYADDGDAEADWERNAEYADEWERNAEFGEERDADGEERDWDGEERDADAEKRDADAEERDWDGEERDASAEEYE
jgi:hypothetical protein